MELSHGKQTGGLNRADLFARIAGWQEILVDLGTGDGRVVLQSARSHPQRFAIGIDTCRENLRTSARQLPQNALLLIADARALPVELTGLATAITINFPWGSLLTALLTSDGGLIDGVRRTVRPGATLDVRLNGGALDQAGCSPVEGGALVARTLRTCGFEVGPAARMDAQALRTCTSSWGKRLAFGRDPWALHLRATLPVIRGTSLQG